MVTCDKYEVLDKLRWDWLTAQSDPIRFIDRVAAENPWYLHQKTLNLTEAPYAPANEKERQLAMFILANQMSIAGWPKDEYAYDAVQLGVRPKFLLQARSIAGEVGTKALASDSLANYALIESVRSSHVIPFKLDSFAHRPDTFSKSREKYAVRSIAHEDAQGAGWVFHPNELEGGNPETLSHVFLDAPVGLQLVFQGKTEAVVSFTLSSETLVIRQLQGISTITEMTPAPFARRYGPRGLARLRWSEVLIKAAEQVATSVGITHVAVVSAANNAWESVRSSDSARNTYNYAAQSMGYQVAGDGDWHKSL